jgi:hypothetical protein
MHQVNFMTASPKMYLPHRKFAQTIIRILAMLLAGWFGCSEARAAREPQTTLVVFADHRMNEEQWSDLFSALQSAKAANASTSTELAGDVEIVRGDRMIPGLSVDSVISVFLHGDCTLLPRQRLFVQGALGWVPRSKGIIEPFVNVDCTRIVSMLGPLALGMSSSRRDRVMAEAMARVIMHEWIHIATQNARHETHGITRPLFDVRDLLADDPEMRAGRSHKRI